MNNTIIYIKFLLYIIISYDLEISELIRKMDFDDLEQIEDLPPPVPEESTVPESSPPAVEEETKEEVK